MHEKEIDMLSNPFLSRDIGQTENTLRALLLHVLQPTTIATYEHYITMTLIGGGERDAPRAEVERQLANSAQIEPSEAVRIIDDLIAQDLVAPAAAGAPVRLTEPGGDVLRSVQAEIAGVSRRVHAGIPDADIERARTTLTTLRQAASAILAEPVAQS